MKKTHFLTLILCFFLYNASIFSQALKRPSKEDLIQYSKICSQPDDSFGFALEEGDLPVSFSLKYFSPGVVEQDGGSCVGHAIATSLSITYTMKNAINEWGRSFNHKFDPYYIYSALKDDNDITCSIGCECGASMREGLELVMNYGIKKEHVSPELKCRDRLNKKLIMGLFDRISNYTIDDYYPLIRHNDDGSKDIWDIINIKKCIYYGYAPIVAIDVLDDFDNVSSLGIYRLPNKIHYTEDELSGHAVVLIGWDDMKNGGSFLFQNSYGTDWGDDGFFWLTYKDFYKQVDRAYVADKEDFSDWKDSYRLGDYYKGPVAKKDGYFWEGGINSDNFFHGFGIFDGPNFSSFGAYDRGYKDGWWLMCDDLYSSDGIKNEDPFFGWILFDQGEIIESESLGFTAGENESQELVIERLKLNSYDLSISKEPATINDFKKSDINLFKSKLSGIKSDD